MYYTDNLKIKMLKLMDLRDWTYSGIGVKIDIFKGPEDELFNNTFLEKSKVKECVTIILYRHGNEELKMYGTLEEGFVKINHITNIKLSIRGTLYNYGWFFKETTGTVCFENNGIIIKYTDGVYEYLER